jgi:ABC-type sugar transport system ATPase subunit
VLTLVVTNVFPIQALPPLTGTPLDLLKEAVQYKSRSGAVTIPEGKSGTSSVRLTTLLAFTVSVFIASVVCCLCFTPARTAVDCLGALPVACEKLEQHLLLPAGKMTQLWTLLSGGERQRAIIACGLILASAPDSPLLDEGTPPRYDKEGVGTEAAHARGDRGAISNCVLLLDEPTAACDEAACAAVERAIKASNVACIIVTHDPRQALRLAHTRIVLSETL